MTRSPGPVDPPDPATIAPASDRSAVPGLRAVALLLLVAVIVLAPRAVRWPHRDAAPEAAPAVLCLVGADEAALRLLPGIGPVLAARIVEARSQAGFVAIDDLRRVPGIGPVTVERLRPFLRAPGAPSPGDLGTTPCP